MNILKVGMVQQSCTDDIAANIANVSFESVVKEVLPYIGTYVLLLILFIFVPGILTIFA